MQAIMYVLEFPPRLSCRILVNLEFLNEINWESFLSVERADMTFPSSRSPKFILIPSFIVAPVVPVFFILSDPARSTKKNLAVMNPSSDYWRECCSIKIVNIAWDLEEESFMRVAAVVRLMLPLSRRASIPADSLTYYSTTPWIDMEPSFYSRIDTLFSFILW